MNKAQEPGGSCIGVDTVNAMIVATDEQGNIVEWNKVCRELTGYSKEEMLSQSLSSTVVKEDQSSVEGMLKRAIAGDPVAGTEFRMVARSGKTVVIQMNATARLNGSNMPDGVIGIGIDITEKRAAKTKMKLALTEFTALIDTANVPIFAIDTERRVVTWNQATEALTKYSKEEVLGRDLVGEFVGDEYKKRAMRVLDNALKGEEVQNLEFTLKAKNNEHVRVLLSTTARRDVAGNIVGVFGVGQDITELTKYRISLEEEIKTRTSDVVAALSETSQARDSIDSILKCMADGLVATDLHNRVILMNRAAEDLLHLRFSEVVGRPIEFSIEEETLRNRVASTLEKQQEGYAFDFELPSSSKARPQVIRARTSAMRDVKGDLVGIITTMHDVSHEREVDRMKTEFISTAAHELRTPLTSIQGFSEILLTRADIGVDETVKFLTYINRMSKKLADVIGDLLDISRLEARHSFALDRAACNAGEEIKQILPMYMDNFKNHQFTVEMPDTSAVLIVDKAKMHQVLDNLLNNAVKYSPDGGPVHVKGLVTDEDYRVSIIDQGIGMTEGQVEHMFDKFYRADASNTAIEGTGLGMAIVKHIVEAHGGQVWVDSEKGKGTTVTFTIPFTDEMIEQEVQDA